MAAQGRARARQRLGLREFLVAVGLAVQGRAGARQRLGLREFLGSEATSGSQMRNGVLLVKRQ